MVHEDPTERLERDGEGTKGMIRVHGNCCPNTEDDADVTLTILSMFTVAKAILEVLTVSQELNVIRPALCYYCAWNCSSKAGTQK